MQVPSPDPVFDYMMGDVMTTVVVELIATPPQVWLIIWHRFLFCIPLLAVHQQTMGAAVLVPADAAATPAASAIHGWLDVVCALLVPE